MRLLLHILKKDVRHFYPEVLVNLALLIAFAWIEPHVWGLGFAQGGEGMTAGLLRGLLPVAWLVMISRVLHDEVLVGDRQFWITRPYPWTTLLGEKVLFLVAFLHVPFFLMQGYLLHRAGLAIAPAFGRLVAYQGLVAVVFTLPFVALTVVTASFGKQILTVLACILYLIGAVALAGWLTRRQMAAPYVDWVLLVAVAGTLVAVIVAMYARRRVARARVVLACLPLALVLVVLCMPTRLLVSRVYANSSFGDALSFDSDPKFREDSAGDPLIVEKNVVLRIPVLLHMPTTREEATPKGIQVSLTAASGDSWRSEFQTPEAWLHSDTPDALQLFMPVAVYERMRAQPVRMEMEAAMERFAFPAMKSFTVPADGQFAMSDDSVCHPNLLTSNLQCRYSVSAAPPVLFKLELQRERCGEGSQRETVTRRTSGATAELSADFDPVTLQYIPLWMREDDEGRVRMPSGQLCPGAQAGFAFEQATGRERLFMTASSVLLSEYVVPRQGRPRLVIRSEQE